jgi:hypothetical protein
MKIFEKCSFALAFALFAALAGCGQPALARVGDNLLLNPGFESGANNWTFSGGTGIGFNRPHAGTSLAYLDAGTDKRIYQRISISESGTYELSAWVSGAGTTALIGASVNGLATQGAIPDNLEWNQAKVGRINAAAGDTIEVYVTGSASSWVNVDDFDFYLMK